MDKPLFLPCFTEIGMNCLMRFCVKFSAIWILGALFFVSACGSSTNQSVDNVPLIPLRSFFKKPGISFLLLSPSGDKIAFTRPYKKRMNLFVASLGSTDTSQLTFFTDRDIASYFWKSDTCLLILKDQVGDENFHLYAVNPISGRVSYLTPFPGVRIQVIDEFEQNENEVILALNKRRKDLFDAYSLNLQTGKLTMLAQNPGNIATWICDHKGIVRLGIGTNGLSNEVWSRTLANDSFHLILRTSYRDQVQPIVFEKDNQSVYAISNLGRDKSALIKMDASSGHLMETIYEHPEVDVEHLDYSKKSGKITAVTFHIDKPDMIFFDSTWAGYYRFLKSKLGNQHEIVITSSSRDEQKFLVRTISDKSLGASYFFNAKDNELVKIAERGPWLKEEFLCDMKPFYFTSSDGIKIQGYLTLPKNKISEKLPLVVNPHGGPWLRDFWGFNPEVQFLANRGYAVLQVNFRGSTGFGRKFHEAGFGEWGLKMQDDITDGVKYLIKSGLIDSTRIAIYGGSYGGYAALAGLTFTPDLYACGVDYVGVSNLFTFMNTIPPYWKPFKQMYYQMIGDPIKDSIRLYKTSPVFHVDKIKAPLFIAQGVNDPRVNKNESDQVVEALKKRGVSVKYMVKENEGHGFLNEENQIEFYSAMEWFLAKHIGGRIESSYNQ